MFCLLIEREEAIIPRAGGKGTVIRQTLTFYVLIHLQIREIFCLICDGVRREVVVV